MKQDWLKKAYRNWFAQLDEEVPEEVWTGIEDELDIDEVWAHIHKELRPAQPLSLRSWVVRIAAAFLLLLSCLAAYRYLLNPGTGTKNGIAEHSLPETDAFRGERFAGKDSSFRKDSFPPAGRSGNAGIKAIAALPEREIEPAAGRTPEERLLSPVPNLPARPYDAADFQALRAEMPKLLKPEGLLAGIRHAAPPTGPAGKAPFIRLQRLGLVSAYNNTWMLNHETINGLQSSTLTATAATFGTSTALNAAFLVNGRHRFGAELYFSSHTGQRYQQYIEARYQRRNIELDYYKFQLFYQLPVFSGKGDLLAGAYASYLKRGREEIAGEARTIGRFYHSIDYGLMTGYQFNLPLSGRMHLHPGVRVNYGLPNIFKGNGLIPDNFLRTHNAAIGLYLGVSYKLF